MYDFVDILCMLCGAYLLYTGVVMKVQGRIISNVVLRKNTNEDSIRDKEGFIQYLYWKLAVIGIVIILSSIASLFSGSMGDSTVKTKSMFPWRNDKTPECRIVIYKKRSFKSVIHSYGLNFFIFSLLLICSIFSSPCLQQPHRL